MSPLIVAICRYGGKFNWMKANPEIDLRGSARNCSAVIAGTAKITQSTSGSTAVFKQGGADIGMFWTVIIFANKGEKSVTSGIFILQTQAAKQMQPKL